MHIWENTASSKSEKLELSKPYPLAELFYTLPRDVRAIWIGEKRKPRKGEWYLSGSVIEAYRAPNDLGQVFHIAKLVRTKTEVRTVVTILGEYKPNEAIEKEKRS